MMDLTILTEMNRVALFPVSPTQLHKSIESLHAAAVCQVRCLLQKKLTHHLKYQKVHQNCYHIWTQSQVRNISIRLFILSLSVEGCSQDQDDFESVPQSKPPIVPRKLKPPISPRTTCNIFHQLSEEDKCMKSFHCTTDVSLPSSDTVIRFRSHTIEKSNNCPPGERYRRRLKTHEMVILKDKNQGRFVYMIKLLVTSNQTYLQ